MSVRLRAADSDSAPSGRSPGRFVALLVAVSIPFWIGGSIVHTELLPGLPIVYALISFCPVIAGSILVYTESGHAGLAHFLRRAFDYRRVIDLRWYAPIFLLMPAISLLSYAWMQVKGWPLPRTQLPLPTIPAMFVGFFVGGIGEELGWTGYATEPLQSRFGAPMAAILLGAVWAGWHLVQLFQLDHSLMWIAWWCVGTVASRVIMVWLYTNCGRSVNAIILFHVSQNLSWQLFPNSGSHWNPRINAIILTGAVVLISAMQHARALARGYPRTSKTPTKVGWRD